VSKIPIFKSGQTSQCWQDVFAHSICGNGGTYIEIGGSWPKKNSNTYSLELFANYKGFSIELDKEMYFNPWSESERKNKIYWDNALTFDYKNAVEENNMSTHINYLSCDIEPPENTFNALIKIINDGITFDVITFEHELFKCKTNYDILARDFLLSNGYKIAVSNVYHKKESDIFETWYINKDIDYKEQLYSTWKEGIKKL